MIVGRTYHSVRLFCCCLLVSTLLVIMMSELRSMSSCGTFYLERTAFIPFYVRQKLRACSVYENTTHFFVSWFCQGACKRCTRYNSTAWHTGERWIFFNWCCFCFCFFICCADGQTSVLSAINPRSSNVHIHEEIGYAILQSMHAVVETSMRHQNSDPAAGAVYTTWYLLYDADRFYHTTVLYSIILLYHTTVVLYCCVLICTTSSTVVLYYDYYCCTVLFCVKQMIRTSVC